MKYDYQTFKGLWTVLVTKRPGIPALGSEAITNGVEPHTVKALIAISKGDHSQFDALASRFTPAAK